METTSPSHVVWALMRTGTGQNERGHWATINKRNQKEKKLIIEILNRNLGKSQADIQSAQKIIIKLTRYSPKAKLQPLHGEYQAVDDDNLRGGLKAIRDGIAIWLRRDDGDDSLFWEYYQAKGHHGLKCEFICSKA
jgi:hypothetical protein